MKLVWTVILVLLAAGAWAAISSVRGGDVARRDRFDDGRAEAAKPEMERFTEAPPAPEPLAPSSVSASATAETKAASSVLATPALPLASVAAEPSPAPVVPPAPLSPAAPALPSAPAASIQPLPDGDGFTLDGRFVVRGSGTEANPLRVPWDLLTSAQESYDPAANKLDLPSRVTTLSGRTVRLTGYFAAGVTEDETRDLLVMLNKWDGCCLGLPPTPYDAVEVKLAEPMRLKGQHMLRYGTITGKFECEPFLVAGWLVGMYRLTDATLEWGG